MVWVDVGTRGALRLRMQPISDALELLTAQHGDIDALLTSIAQAPNPGRRSQMITELADQLTIHLAVEQELFYPAVSMLSEDILAEHVEIKRALADLLWRESDDERDGHTLARLNALFSAHVRQECELFETIAQACSPARLAQIGDDITGWIDGLVARAA